MQHIERRKKSNFHTVQFGQIHGREIRRIRRAAQFGPKQARPKQHRRYNRQRVVCLRVPQKRHFADG